MQNLASQILIAPPAVKGNFWYKSVILITEHHNQGSVGIVLNKRSQMSIVEFGEQLGFDIDVPGFVYLGGPVSVKSLSFLHTNDWVSKNTMRVSNQFSISSADDILPRLAEGDRPAQWRLFLGMCGWGPNQLSDEIKGTPPRKHEHSWLTTKYNEELVFGSDNNDQWCNALDRSGLEFAQNVLA
jgi:putative transcriptional regulator